MGSVRITAVRMRGAVNKRLLGALAIWAALALIAVLWWKPWNQHPNVERAEARERGETPAASATGDAEVAGDTTAAAAATGTDTVNAQASEMVPAELPDPATLLSGSHITLARITADAAEGLDDGATVAKGDQLRIGAMLPYRMHVYAFNQEQGAATTVMFPLAALAHSNPLPAGNNELPGMLDGRNASYEVMARGDYEDILLVIALEPDPGLDAKLATLNEVAEGDAAPPEGSNGLSIDALAESLAPAVAADQVRVFRWRLRHAEIPKA